MSTYIPFPFESESSFTLSKSTVSIISEDEKEESASKEIIDSGNIKWINIIFLPFQLWWQLIMIVVIFVKCILGPLNAVHPFAYCIEDNDLHYLLVYLKMFYYYACNMFYTVDTFLYIVHRQVSEEATRREYTPKPAILLLLDVISVLPLFDMFSDETCGAIYLWPNLLRFNETVLLYRLVIFFELSVGHNYITVLIGYIIVYIIVINAFTCLFLVWTYHGLCSRCSTGIYDWRIFKAREVDTLVGVEKDIRFYFYTACYTQSLILHVFTDTIRPFTYMELAIAGVMLLLGYFLTVFIVMPKLFCESIMRFKAIFSFHAKVNRIIEETQNRNPLSKAHEHIERFYIMLWKKHNGLSKVPKSIEEIPDYLSLDIKHNLRWPLFQHSPCLRRTSASYKRWLCNHITLSHKQPGERFFSGDHCYSNIYYIKTGIVQFISLDDTTVPMISVTSGTLLGDVSFFIPPLNRKVIVHCLTYCKVLSVSRRHIINSLQKFPEDRRNIMKHIRDRLKHAQDLFQCKMSHRGVDRTEDEGIAWVKRRWWQVAHTINYWKKSSTKSKKKCEIPPEESDYHCTKYIGQLVLCKDNALQSKSIFIKEQFPWMLAPNSVVITFWHNVMRTIIFLALLSYPPLLSRMQSEEIQWFTLWSAFVDIILIIDVLFSLVTAVESPGMMESTFSSIIAKRCKTMWFVLDVLATPVLDTMMYMIKDELIRSIVPMNPVLKIYIFFFDKYEKVWKKNVDPIIYAYVTILGVYFCYTYISSFILYIVVQYQAKDFTERYFFWGLCLNTSDCSIFSISPSFGIFGVPIGRLLQWKITYRLPNTIMDNLFGAVFVVTSFIMGLFLKVKHIAAVYSKYHEMVNYQHFVSNLKNHYINLKIHPDLLNRLQRYLQCHWMYHHGEDIVRPDYYKDEPYDVYSNLHGTRAEKIIGESKAFTGASSQLIKELACNAKFLILPNKTTMIMFGVQIENVVWISQGVVTCEYQDNKCETQKITVPLGEVLAMTSIFLERIPLRTYYASSDIEILYLPVNLFYNTIRRYPNEWLLFQTCADEVRPLFDDVFINHLKQHRDYHRKLRERVFHAKQSAMVLETEMIVKKNEIPIPDLFKNYRRVPESRFSIIWLIFRALCVLVYLAALTIEEAFVGHINVREILYMIKGIGIASTVIGMVFKTFLPFYDERGIIITNIYKCALHYWSTTFLIDLVTAVTLVPGLVQESFALGSPQDAQLVIVFIQGLLVYNLIGFFNYWADQPSTQATIIMIVKWQVLTAICFCYLFCILFNDCVFVNYNDEGMAVSLNLTNETCWMPKFNANTTWRDIYYKSWGLSLSVMTDSVLGAIRMPPKNLCYVVITSSFFWFQTNYCVATLMLRYRGETVFQHGIEQLKTFLEEERVEKETIEKSVSHFLYWWKRTAGVNMKILMNERIGAVFRQDINYFFYSKTLKAADTVLGGDDTLKRQLANCVTEEYFLPGEDIVREMDLTPKVYIVHRGKVAVTTKDGEKCILTKGSIFGQLLGTIARPINITVTAETHADVLSMTLKQFQDSITDDVRDDFKNIKTSSNNYLSQGTHVQDNPFNSLEYILRGAKVLKIPGIMKQPIMVEDNRWYQRWLLLAWAISPVLTASFLFFLLTGLREVLIGFRILDAVHFAHFVTDFFTMKMVVEETTAKYVYLKWGKLTMLSTYIDIVSLVFPWLAIFVLDKTHTVYQYMVCTRFLRLYWVYVYYRLFGNELQSKTVSTILKIVLLLLLMQALTYTWVTVDCKFPLDRTFPFTIYELPSYLANKIDDTEWCNPLTCRISGGYRLGCIRITPSFLGKNSPAPLASFYKPTQWLADYLISGLYMTVLFTHTNMDVYYIMNTENLVLKIVTVSILYLLNAWLTSVVISVTYTKYREMYKFDYAISKLVLYMKQNDVSKFLQNAVESYSKLRWQRQKGSWLPDITKEASLCVREDIMSSLYIHHLLTPAIFSRLPNYFLRQLAVRLKRIVIFPGKFILRAGDIFPIIYFIHEGEVEKWDTDANGERRMVSLLTINGYFGLLPGLFPNMQHNFTYTTRTVVDLVFLKHDDWQDLINGYPDIKHNLYSAAQAMKKEGKRTHPQGASTATLTRSSTKASTSSVKKL